MQTNFKVRVECLATTDTLNWNVNWTVFDHMSPEGVSSRQSGWTS